MSLKNVNDKLLDIHTRGFRESIFNTSAIDVSAIEKYNQKILAGIPAQDALSSATKGTNNSTRMLLESANGATISTEQLTSAQKASTVASRAQSVALKAVSIAGNAIAFYVITKGIQLATKAIDEYVNRTKYAIERMEEAEQSISSAQTNLKNLSSTIEENRDRFLELSEGVDKFSRNVKLSEEDYAEYLSISNQLAEISPTLVSGYDDQGNALIRLGENAEDTNAKLNDILETEKALAEQTLIDNLDSVAEGVYYQVEEASNEIARLQEELNSFSDIEGLKLPENLFQDVDENTKSFNYGALRDTLDTEEIDKLRKAILDSGARVFEDETFDTMSIFAKDISLVENAIKDFYSQIGYIENNESSAYINGLKKDIVEQEKTIKETYSKMNSNLSAWVKSTYEYDYLGDSQKDLIDSLIPSLDWKSIKDSTGKSFVSADEYEQYIKDNIIAPLMSIPDEHKNEVNQKFAQLLEFETGDIDIVDFVTELQNYLDGLGTGITIDLTPLLGNTEEIKKNYNAITESAVAKFTSKNRSSENINAERKALDDFAKKNSINTQNEIAFWNQCLEESNTREEAMKKYLEGGSEKDDETRISSLSDYLNQEDNDDIAKIKDDLLELARAGEITEDTFNSTKEYREILSELGITSEEASRQLMQMTDLEMDLSDWQTQISNARSSISELQDFVKEINKEGLSSSSIDKIVTDYPQLLKHLDDTPALLTEINKLIEEQSINAQNAGNMLVEYNASAYDQIKSTAQSAFDQIEILQNGQIKSLADMYGIDLDNYSSLAQAKKEIEFALLGSLNAGWASHFGIVIDSLTGFATATENLGEYYNNKENQEKVSQYNQLISKLNKAKEQFEGKVNYGGVGTSSSSSDKDTSKEFDWIKRAVDNIEKQISRADKIANSAYSSASEKNKALADQIHLVNQEIALQQQAYEGYMAKAESVGLSDKYKNLVQSGAINIEDITDEDLQKAIKLYQDYYDKAQDTLEKISDLHEEAKQKHVDGYELEADELKRKLDTQSITEKQYIDDMLVLWERYYENQVEYAEVAKNKKLDILAEEKSYLEKVASAATGILDYEINKLEEQKENAVKGYKAEIEVYEEKIDAVEAQIEVIEEQVDVIEEKRDALQDTLDNLEKQRTKEQEILNLQKAQYELERAKTQRTKLQYQDGQIKYVTDDSAIKTAREELDEAEFTITKRGIQDQIDDYDSQIDGLNKQVDGLNKVIDGYNKQIDSLNVLIDKSDAYYDGEIANLEKIKNEWTKALEIEQRAIDIRNFTDQFGEGAISRLISGDMSLVNEWKQSYLDTLEEIDLTSQGKVGAITEKFAELAGVDLTNAANQAKGVTSEIEALTDSVNDASTAIAGASSGNGEEPSKSKGEQSTSANSLVGAIDASYTTASEKLPAETEMMDGFTEATMSATEMMNGLTESTILATGEVDKLGEAINALPNEKTITIKIETQGSIPSVGGSSISSSSTKTSKVDGRPAHAEGTAKVTGDWGVREGGKTLVGELGQEIVVRGSRFFTVGDNGAEFVDLQKGDIVFNHLQSKELLSKGNLVGRGNALAEGTIKSQLPSYLRPIQEGDKGYELIRAAKVYQDMLKTNILLPVSAIDKNVDMMARNISAVNNHTNVNSSPVVNMTVNCPGITSKEVANQVGTEIQKVFFGLENNARQKMSITR